MLPLAFYYDEPAHTFSEYLLVPGYSSSECIPDNRKFESEQDSKLKEQIEEFLRNLSKEKRAIFLGRFWFLYSVAEIAERLGRDEKYVSNQLYYLKKQFKKHLGRKEGYNERIGFTQSINRN